MTEQGEQLRRKTPEELTRERIDRYRESANGLVDIHVYSLNGEPQRECFTEPGIAVSEQLQEAMLVGFDEQGAEVPLDYSGVMPAIECIFLADSLESQL